MNFKSYARKLLPLLVAINVLTTPASTIAYTESDLYKIKMNTANYGDDELPCVTTTLDISGNDNLRTILVYFTASRGLSLAAAAGIAANIKAESFYNPRAIQNSSRPATDSYIPVGGTGFGLVQWTSSGRQRGLVSAAEAKSLPVTDMSVQLDYIWQELNGGYRLALSALATNHDDPGRAAYDFHKIYEGSADSEKKIQKNRVERAVAIYQQFKSSIEDGKGVTTQQTSPTDPSGPETTCNDEGVNLGVGAGNFTDNGEVKGWENVIENSRSTDRLFGESMVNKYHCAAIVSRVWRGANIGYASHNGSNAIDLWYKYGSTIGHKDRSPKKGAILLYKANHVVIYLGNNLILNDGHIVDANFPEKDWNLTYMGWVDPNDVGWVQSSRASDGELISWMSSYKYRS